MRGWLTWWGSPRMEGSFPKSMGIWNPMGTIIY